jgi:hypothetical protein
MIVVPRMTTPEELEKACHRITYYPMEQREAVADAILKAVNQLRFAGAIDEANAGRYRQVAARHKMEAQRWQQLKQKQSELSEATSDMTPSGDSGSETDDLGSLTEKIETVEPSTEPTSSNPIQTGPSSSSTPAQDQPSTPTMTSRGASRSKKGGRGS